MISNPLPLLLRICLAGFLALPALVPASTDTPRTDGAAGSEAPESADNPYRELLENSPFLRPLNLAHTLVVTGIADVEGETLATIFDRDDDSTTLVTDANGNERGMQILGIRRDRRSKQVALKISVKGAEIEIPFDVDALLPRNDGANKSGDGRDGRGDGRGDGRRDGGRDSGRGSPPPKHIMDKYHSMSREQREAYWKWASDYYAKNPEIRNSDKRFPVVEKAIEAIKSGNRPPSD